MKIGVVIPCYNEEKRLNSKEFSTFISQNENFVFCFVNDGSSDNTPHLLSDMKDTNPSKVEIIHLLKNRGKAEAVRNGLLLLAKDSSIDFIGYMDADLATPLLELHSIMSIIATKNKKVVFGSRIIHLGAKVKRNFFRFIFGRIFATIVSRWILELPIYDTQCGFKFFEKGDLSALIQDPFKSKWFFDIEIFKRFNLKYGKDYLNENGYECFLETWEDKLGTKLTIFDFLKTPIELIKLKNL